MCQIQMHKHKTSKFANLALYNPSNKQKAKVQNSSALQ